MAGFAGAQPVAVATPATAEQPVVHPEQTVDRQAELIKDVTQGALRIVAPGGGMVECPLVHTDVKAEISGFLARVRVTQTFKNPKDEKIEAVYVFPLPHESAIDELTMRIGERRIEGKIKRRDDARRIYEQALLAGQTAALLEQERPNIFTQSVGNIPAGETVRVEIAYVDVLKYDVGTYEFSFPMVVGPRFNPGSPSPPQPLNHELAGHAVPGGAATTRVPDGDRINPPILKPGHRTGHDISLTVHLDAGVPVQNMEVKSHESSIERTDNRRAIVKLNETDSIPNKDFVLRYDVTGEKPAMVLLAHKPVAQAEAALRPDRDAGYFMLMVQPAEDERLKNSPPREIVFLVDVSGSMSGEPTQKVIETMRHMLSFCREGVDTVQVVTFASQANQLFNAPEKVTPDSITRATQFTNNIRAGGGTQMLEGVMLAMDQPVDPERVRIIIMLTDGYIGNETEIIEHVGKRSGDQIRFWCVGIGASPNMFLIDGVAKQGHGMGKQLNLNDDSQTLAQEVISRIQRAQLSNVEIDWGGINVFDTYPAKIPELWSGRPVILFGRYKDASGTFAINVKGRVEGVPATWPLKVELPKEEPKNDVLAPTWARQKVEDLMHSAYYADSPPVAEAVTALALDYRLMSQYTSFVAVDDSQAPAETPAARPHRMLVPVPLPAGTRWEGFFGPQEGISPQTSLAMRGLKRRQFGAEMLSELHSGAEGRLSIRTEYSLDLSRLSQQIVPTSQSGARRGRGGGKGVAPSGALATAGFGGGGRQGRGGRAAMPAQPTTSLPATVRPEALDRSERFVMFDRAGAVASSSERGEALAIADKPSADNELMWLSQLGQDADPNAHVFVWEQSADGWSHYVTVAQAAFEAGAKALEAKDTATARREFARAVYFAETQANRRPLGDAVSLDALAELERLRREDVVVWTKAAPKLATRLDLVVRDRSIEDTIAQVARAAGITIDIVPGSIADAAALADDTRVHYLDLRRATVAETLEWILTPARLTWRPDGEKVIVGSARRMPGVSPWIYDVAAMALPRHAELGDPAKQDEYLANAQKATNAFIAAVRARLEATSEGVQWYAPGELLVVGEPAMHNKAAAFFAELADANAPAASDLHKLARERLAARKESRDKADAASAQLRALAALDEFGWPLLSAAAAGRLDIEALTELQIAWKALDLTKVPSGLELVLLRTAWIANESAAALPSERELQAFAAMLAANTREASQAAVAAISAPGEKSLAQYAAATYAALARRGDSEFSGRAYEAITAATAEPTKWLTRTVVAALFGRGGDAAPSELAKLVRAGAVQGEDDVVLTALACRRAGGEAWTTFRAEAADLLGRQPLDGDVVVFVNGLSSTRLPLVAAAR